MAKRAHPTPKLGGVKGAKGNLMDRLKSWFKFALGVERRFREDDALMMAAALSYTSLLSLVPLLTIALAIIAAFPAFEAIRGELSHVAVRTLVPEVGQQVRHIIDELVGNAGNLTAIGVLGLVVTAILLLVTIEDSLNRIFRISRPRPPMSRLLVYWTVVTLGPILLAASLSITDWLMKGTQVEEVSALVEYGGAVFRFSMQVALFTLLFCAVPNRKIPIRDALPGGVLAAAAIGLLRFGFHIYVAEFKAYQNVYGALAAIPILLFWMYLVWVAVLVGAEFTASLVDRRFEAHSIPALRRTS
jgi:membrane protein